MLPLKVLLVDKTWKYFLSYELNFALIRYDHGNVMPPSHATCKDERRLGNWVIPGKMQTLVEGGSGLAVQQLIPQTSIIVGISSYAQ